MPATFRPYDEYHEYPGMEMSDRARAFLDDMSRRRTVREFSDRPVPRQVIEDCLRTACTAPSGANQQPWHFVAVQHPDVKRRIRDAAEAEERAFYGGRAPEEWLAALEQFGTSASKPFLVEAPWLIAVFAQPFGLATGGPRDSSGACTLGEATVEERKIKHYYVQESVGIATGFLIAALHHAGLATLTHTPSPMGFLSHILERPPHERAYLLLVAGYPSRNARVPTIAKKAPHDAFTFV